MMTFMTIFLRASRAPGKSWRVNDITPLGSPQRGHEKSGKVIFLTPIDRQRRRRPACRNQLDVPKKSQNLSLPSASSIKLPVPASYRPLSARPVHCPATVRSFPPCSCLGSRIMTASHLFNRLSTFTFPIALLAIAGLVPTTARAGLPASSAGRAEAVGKPTALVVQPPAGTLSGPRAVPPLVAPGQYADGTVRDL